MASSAPHAPIAPAAMPSPASSRWFGGSALPVTCATRIRCILRRGEGAPARWESSVCGRAGLPGDFIDHAVLLDRFGITRAGAIVSPGAADADPMKPAHGLLRTALARGARSAARTARKLSNRRHATV